MRMADDDAPLGRGRFRNYGITARYEELSTVDSKEGFGTLTRLGVKVVLMWHGGSQILLNSGLRREVATQRWVAAARGAQGCPPTESPVLIDRLRYRPYRAASTLIVAPAVYRRPGG